MSNSQFNRAKAIEAIVYLAQRITDPTYHSIAKLLYFADKTHLEKYGRLICGDTYYAMQYGPVPSNIYSLLRDASPDELDDIFIIQNGREVVAQRDANLDEMSESDVLCLDQAIAMYGDKPMWYRTQHSHDDAWARAWTARGERKSVLMPLESIAAQFEEADELIAHLNDPHPGSASE